MTVGTQGLFRPYLKAFVPPFLPTRLTAPGSPRMEHFKSLKYHLSVIYRQKTVLRRVNMGSNADRLEISRRDLGTKKIKPNKEICPEGFGVMLKS